MSEISINQPHNKSLDEIRELIYQVADKLEQRYELKAHWISDTELKLHRHGVTGMITLLEEEVVVRIKLGMMMRPLRGTIHKAVANAMSENLAD